MRPVARLASFVFCLGLAVPAFAGFQSTETFLPAVGRLPGQGGAQFYTTVWATNLTGVPVTFTFDFLKNGQANPSPANFQDTLAPGQTKMYENVVESKFGLTNALGAARVTSSGEILLAERIYDQAPGDDLGKTVGLFFAGVPKTFSIVSGQSASIQGVNQGGSENFRYNFALIETGGGSPTVNVQVFDGNGVLLGQKAYPLSPYEQLQPGVGDVVAGFSSINARITAAVTGGTGSVLLAGAQLANESQDSSGFEMSFRDSILGSGGGTAGVTSLNSLTGALTLTQGNGISITPSGSSIAIAYTGGGAGGLTSVTHDATLAGAGTGASPLGIALPLKLSGTTAVGTVLASVLGLGSGTGILGTSSSGTGIIGSADSSGVGVAGAAMGIGPAQVVPAGTGVFGVGANFGVIGETNPGGTGVAGRTNGGNAGVEGLNFGAGPGVSGTSGGGIGVSGSSNAANSAGTGVKGEAEGMNATGVLGIANNGGSSYGIWGESAHGFAGKFNGKVDIEGTLSVSGLITAGSKFFKIDDPLDPENKYLVHASVESSEMTNIYSGNVTLGPDGGAVVILPAWVEAANGDFRYQLTCIGGFAGVYVAHEVSDGRFSIAGGIPWMKVSWQLTGIRRDAFAKAHPLVVEEEKAESERGLYLHPDLFGQPEKKGIEGARMRAKRLPASERPVASTK